MVGRLRVVIDSSVLCSDLHLEGHSFSIFFDGVKNTDLRLFVPRIVIDEVVNHFRQKVLKNTGRIKASERNIAKLLKRPIFPIINEKQIDEECNRYRRTLIGNSQAENRSEIVV
jgi:predicted nucleic acid-binding protein